ncbi:MAG: hypothetical protein QW734_06430 [Candidatus Bathyarchaeia archaeon]
MVHISSSAMRLAKILDFLGGWQPNPNQVHRDFARRLPVSLYPFFRCNFGDWVTKNPPEGLGWSRSNYLSEYNLYWNLNGVAVTDLAYVLPNGSLWSKEQFLFGMMQVRANIGNKQPEPNVRKSIGFGNVLDHTYVAFKLWDDEFVAEVSFLGRKETVDIDPTPNKYLCDAQNTQGTRTWVILWLLDQVRFYITPSHTALQPDLVAVIERNVPRITLEYDIISYSSYNNTINVAWCEYYGADPFATTPPQEPFGVMFRKVAGEVETIAYEVPAGRRLVTKRLVCIRALPSTELIRRRNNTDEILLEFSGNETQIDFNEVFRSGDKIVIRTVFINDEASMRCEGILE